MFHKETEYALRALVYIQQQNELGHRPGLSEIAREIDAPGFYTGKILQRLVRQGFLTSRKGKGGGFGFGRDKPPLPLRDLILATEGNKILTGCAFGLKECDQDHPCPLHYRYAPIRNALNDLVATATIQSLAGSLTASAPPAREKPDIGSSPDKNIN